MTGNRPRTAATLLLTAVSVGTLIAAPLVTRFALSHGEPGWQGWLYPVMTSGLVVACALFIAGELLAGQRPPWWAWLVLATAVAATGLMAAGQVTGSW